MHFRVQLWSWKVFHHFHGNGSIYGYFWQQKNMRCCCQAKQVFTYQSLHKTWANTISLWPFLISNDPTTIPISVPLLEKKKEGLCVHRSIMWAIRKHKFLCLAAANNSPIKFLEHIRIQRCFFIFADYIPLLCSKQTTLPLSAPKVQIVHITTSWCGTIVNEKIFSGANWNSSNGQVFAMKHVLLVALAWYFSSKCTTSVYWTGRVMWWCTP